MAELLERIQSARAVISEKLGRMRQGGMVQEADAYNQGLDYLVAREVLEISKGPAKAQNPAPNYHSNTNARRA